MPGNSSPISPGLSEPAMSFQFVNLTDPSDTKDQKLRRTFILRHISAPDDRYLTFTAKEVLQSDDAATMSLLRSVWMPFVMTDVALLHAVLLFAASLFRSSMPAHAQVVDLFQLKDMAIQAMNESLSTKDSMIATMATMAQYEAFWRDADAFSTHMSGLRQFVEMRGGLSALGLDGFLERMMVAIDTNLTRTTGHDRSFASSRQSPPGQG
ncbi:hypothetical protein E4T47_04649 [Aureobasidium subglaciale]|nr:hypothetical protein E4T47_04649 [Aureobasidium subglaciale]